MSKKTRKKADRILLLNGCSCTPIKVIPSNWDKPGADPSKEWRAYYRFYDPAQTEHPKFKGGVRLVAIKGMNRYKTLTDKRKATEGLIAFEKEMIFDKGFNPITGEYMVPVEDLPTPDLSPDTPFIAALNKALDEKVCEKCTRDNLKSVMNYIRPAAAQLGYTNIPIGQIKRGHLITLLKKVGENKKDKWTTNNYNHYRSHLGMLYDVLDEWQAVDGNIVHNIKTAKEIQKVAGVKKRPILSNDERILVHRVLKREYYPFWRLMMVFFYAGCRRSEIMRVQGKHVDLVAQKFVAIRKKGRTYTEVEYTITDEALPIWQEIMSGRAPNGEYPSTLENKLKRPCAKDDYIFSVGKIPGPKAIRYDQVTKSWNRWVKKKFGITVDFYPLKHLRTTLTVDKAGVGVAAEFNNESEDMINRHYDQGQGERKHKMMKQLKHDFLPVDPDS